jgi:hypothetical protein
VTDSKTTSAENEPLPPERDPFGGGMEELPPNIPPGFLGEEGPNLRKVDTGGPYGFNAGVIQESTWETTMLSVALAFFVFFPVAYWLLWRSKKVPRKHKVVTSVAMTAALVAMTLLTIFT